MRVLMIALVALFLTEPAFGQQTKPDDPDQPTQLASPITRRQLLELPPTDKAPQLPLQRALKIAESFIKREKINISSCYLFEAKWIQEEFDKEPNWRFWWVCIRVNETATNDLRITVSMNGKAKLNSPMK